jgi:hypothetical protein
LQAVPYLFAYHFLSLAFQIQWQENEGQENEPGGYHVLLPTALSKKLVFQSAQKMSASEKRQATFLARKLSHAPILSKIGRLAKICGQNLWGILESW